MPLSAKPLGEVSSLILSFCTWVGELTLFVTRMVRAAAAPPFEWEELVHQMDEVGAKSAPLVALAGAAVGVVLSMHLQDSLVRFGAKSLLPAVIVLSIITETAPIITALVVSGRVGAGIGAELGSMQVTEQIDAMEASAVDPYKLLIATRVVACVLMLPLLTIVTGLFAILFGWIGSTLASPVSLKLFLHQGFQALTYNDLLPATFKTTVFGLIVGVIGCFQGMRTSGGTNGVGRSATSSVVLASLFVILADVVLVRMIQVLFPR